MKKKGILIVVILLIVAAAVVGFAVFKNGKNGGPKYRKEALTRGDIESLVVSSGTINPVTLVEVGSQVSGKIAKLYVDYNSQVKEGEVLAEIDQSLLRTKIDQNNANYLSAKAALEKAKVTLDTMKKKYDRALSLFEKNLISYEEKEATEANYLGAVTDLQASEARLAQAKSLLDSSRVDLTYAIIRSPIDGVVISRNINLGQTVAASFQAPKLFEIANDLSKMQVECSVDEADIGRVKEGQKVRFTVDAFPDETFSGSVKQVRFSAVVTSNVVTYMTIAEVENPLMKLRPGMTATVSIITGEAKNVLRVPNSALRFTPAIPSEEISKIMKEAGEKMMAKRKADGGLPPREGGAESSGSSAPPAARAATGQEGSQGDFSQGGSGRFGQGGRGGRRPSMVWMQDETGKLGVVFLRPGVTDNAYTEVLRGDLKEGQEVIIGSNSTSPSSSTQRRPSGPPMMFR